MESIVKTEESSKKGKVHFIGVAGSAVSSTAILMKELGWDVSGSDENVYEPARSKLEAAGIKWFDGFDGTRVEDADLVIIGGGVLMGNINNPEFVRAQELGKQVEGYPYVLDKFVIKDESIVVTGTYAKSTITALVNWILECAGENPSYMIGGKSLNFESDVRRTDSRYSCLEGDEYVSVFGFDMEPKFMRYRPKYALISSAKWDHENVYLTEQSYVDAFKKLVTRVEEEKGWVVACASGQNIKQLLQGYNGEFVTYMLEGRETTLGNDIPLNYLAKNIQGEGEKTTFDVIKNGELLGNFSCGLIGLFNIENCLGAITLCDHLGINLDAIKHGVETFKGVKRRQEFRGKTKSGALIYDDFAHSPVKAKAAISAFREKFSDFKIVAIYNPRISSRDNRLSLEGYAGEFDIADTIIIPKIVVKASTPKENRIYGKDILEVLNRSHSDAKYMPDHEELTKYLTSLDEKTVILLMSASSWDELINEVKMEGEVA